MFSKVTFITSNEQKKEEIQELWSGIVFKNVEISEVYGTAEQVVVYKSLLAGGLTLVEDTILIVNGEEWVDTKVRINEIKTGDDLIWRTSIGFNNGSVIAVALADIEGVAVDPVCDGFAFDPIFKPIGFKRTLAELSRDGIKHSCSARTKAFKDAMFGNFYLRIPIRWIPEWEGGFQNE